MLKLVAAIVWARTSHRSLRERDEIGWLRKGWRDGLYGGTDGAQCRGVVVSGPRCPSGWLVAELQPDRCTVQSRNGAENQGCAVNTNERKGRSVTTEALAIEQTNVEFLWLDLTRKCQLSCLHCYNASGPDGSHGDMSREDWLGVLDQASAGGVRDVQFIGGEPSMHPHFAELVDHALTIGLAVEVYSNLVHVSPVHWRLFQRERLSLATSYYSRKAPDHNKVTGRPSHARTRANIVKALALGIPIRVGIVGIDSEAIEEAKADLRSIGVSRIGADRIREFGRACGEQEPDAANLCGGCGDGRAVVDPSGTVAPCVFSTWMGVGNVHDAPLTSILNSPELSEAVSSLHEVWGWGNKDKDNQECRPDCVPKNPCDPRCEPNSACRPGTPTTCRPRF